MSSIQAEKAALRAELRSWRRAHRPARNAFDATFRTLAETERPSVVAAYAPLPGEIDLHPLLDVWSARGVRILFPRVEGRRLAFAGASEGWARGPFQLLEPVAAAEPIESVDLFLCPGLGFTERGHRLGYGGGFYDGVLARANPDARTVGLAWQAQIRPELPVEPHDLAVHALATEVGYRAVRQA